MAIPCPEPRGYPGNLGLLFSEHARSERPAIIDLRDPRRVFFVDRFPLSGTNKVDREALRRLVGTAG